METALKRRQNCRPQKERISDEGSRGLRFFVAAGDGIVQRTICRIVVYSATIDHRILTASWVGMLLAEVKGSVTRHLLPVGFLRPFVEMP